MSAEVRIGDGPIVLGLEPDPVRVFLHRPRSAKRERVAVLFCPPFGWEEVCSYRALRTWADVLADAGWPAARLELPATGDSGGSPTDGDRLAAWTDAISRTAAWLSGATGAERVCALGIGLGGLLAVRAVARGASIDDLVLWSVRSKGTALLREMRAYAGVIADRYPEDSRTELLAEGDLDLAGFLMSAETVRALEDLELTSLALPPGRPRRVLLLERDGLPVDRPLRRHLERTGAAVTVRPTGDYTPMMLEPQDSLTPRDTIATTMDWLEAGSGESERGGDGAVDAAVREPPGRVEHAAMELVGNGAPVRETPVRLDTGHGEAFAVVSERADRVGTPVCAVWLGAGAVRHIGPSRMWVEVARRWAARGVTTVRVDLPGIGEAGGEVCEPVTNANMYSADRVDQARTVLDRLAELGLGDRFVLGGLCAGAYWTFRVAMADERVVGAMMINLYAFTWSEALAAERQTSSALRGLRSALQRRVLRLQIDRELLARAAERLRPARIRAGVRRPAERAQAEEARRAFEAFAERGMEALFLLSHGEALHGQLARLGMLSDAERWPNVRVEALPTRDHVFRSVWLQRLVHDSVDHALNRALARVGVEPRDRLFR
jgi:alpha-beta hydrolase superfamily lysophospholipase